MCIGYDNFYLRSILILVAHVLQFTKYNFRVDKLKATNDLTGKFLICRFTYEVQNKSLNSFIASLQYCVIEANSKRDPLIDS